LVNDDDDDDDDENNRASCGTTAVIGTSHTIESRSIAMGNNLIVIHVVAVARFVTVFALFSTTTSIFVALY
jgi:hypothetical protein